LVSPLRAIYIWQGLRLLLIFLSFKKLNKFNHRITRVCWSFYPLYIC